MPIRSLFQYWFVGSTTVMVSYLHRSANRLSKKITNNIENAYSETGSNSALRSSKSKVYSMENFQHSPPERSLSEKAQSYIKNHKRASIRRMYEARQHIYRSWCIKWGIDLYSASIKDFADFLIHSLELRDCRTSTIAEYRIALAAIYKGWDRSSIN